MWEVIWSFLETRPFSLIVGVILADYEEAKYMENDISVLNSFCKTQI